MKKIFILITCLFMAAAFAPTKSWAEGWHYHPVCASVENLAVHPSSIFLHQTSIYSHAGSPTAVWMAVNCLGDDVCGTGADHTFLMNRTEGAVCIPGTNDQLPIPGISQIGDATNQLNILNGFVYGLSEDLREDVHEWAGSGQGGRRCFCMVPTVGAVLVAEDMGNTDNCFAADWGVGGGLWIDCLTFCSYYRVDDYTVQFDPAPLSLIAERMTAIAKIHTMVPSALDFPEANLRGQPVPWGGQGILQGEVCSWWGDSRFAWEAIRTPIDPSSGQGSSEITEYPVYVDTETGQEFGIACEAD